MSGQIVQEFPAVPLHKFKVPLEREDLQDYIELRLWPKCWVFPTEAVFTQAPAAFTLSCTHTEHNSTGAGIGTLIKPENAQAGAHNFCI